MPANVVDEEQYHQIFFDSVLWKEKGMLCCRTLDKKY